MRAGAAVPDLGVSPAPAPRGGKGVGPRYGSDTNFPSEAMMRTPPTERLAMAAPPSSPHLFSAVRIGSRTLRNHISLAATLANYGEANRA